MLALIAVGVSNHLIFRGCIRISTAAKKASKGAAKDNNARDHNRPMAIVMHKKTATGCRIDIGGKLANKVWVGAVRYFCGGESGEWRVESGKSRVENRKSKVEIGESRVESREWRVESREWKVESREWRVSKQW